MTGSRGMACTPCRRIETGAPAALDPHVKTTVQMNVRRIEVCPRQSSEGDLHGHEAGSGQYDHRLW
ncbi:hypothetical protein CHELA1G11_12582 [Hyphomicrobiales bacterium]|nr:hypothetical protein CHELA1G2_11725 [Hyphomicrobiales bacterium]CAH1665746.1 hypothetical protein CHELA1G11_12582 [Hyphomicrobiales bacterium]